MSMSKTVKAWDWDKNNDDIWFSPCEESYYLLNRWKEKGFNKFLDLGCGRGRHSIQFAKDGFDVTAIDLSEVAVSGLNDWSLRETLSITAKVGNMMCLPIEEDSFDCLLAYHVISHTDSIGINQVIAELHRVLKPGGEFFISFCSKNAWSFRDAGFPKLDDNTIIKIEDGAENDVPHFYADDITIKHLLKGFKMITVRQVQDVILQGSDYVSWHYFVLGQKE